MELKGKTSAITGAVESSFQALASDFGALDGLIDTAGIAQIRLLVKAKDGGLRL